MDDALPTLEMLVGRPADLRFWSDDPKMLSTIIGDPSDLQIGSLEVEQAAIGDFLVIAGEDDALNWARKATGPVVVTDLRRITEQLISVGATMVVPYTECETGAFNNIRHPDGSLVEYVQWKPELVTRIIG
ncbi:VOC family protein [Paenibacillus herberti]|uniref:VOC family protein n=1 Tax=Paenibacillus herberti TaxID=1619309 RepID=UPI001130D3A1|nr:VOC family protein [Paenibacillus herberti]